MLNDEKAFSTKEVSLTLGIGDSTLRKWCLSLEKNGYNFIKNDREQRLFIESDLVILKHFQVLVKDHNMSLESASMVVVDRFGKGAFDNGTGVVLKEDEDNKRSISRSISEYEKLIDKMVKHIEVQEEFNRELLERLDKQQKYIEDSLKKRDETLLLSLKEVQETKKLIAASNQKRGLFSKLFGNK
ncbi:DUF3967 domain-containing protein [Heyndrickxia sporothermodurans]|uniref:DUF3967 domain-containing protein n=1 Tax=Heyndrickxia sporothermodurans TaxID=46224 RepID=UPI002E212DD7|nr:DUF3967 domain-containing protein [Heyndrickxia sporothermodurans]